MNFSRSACNVSATFQKRFKTVACNGFKTVSFVHFYCCSETVSTLLQKRCRNVAETVSKRFQKRCRNVAETVSNGFRNVAETVSKWFQIRFRMVAVKQFVFCFRNVYNIYTELRNSINFINVPKAK